MNWRLGLMIWWKGLLVMTVPCVFLLAIGLWALLSATVISWPAIFIYSTWLWLCKRLQFCYVITIVSLIFIAAPIAIVIALLLFYAFIDDITSYQFSILNLEFLGPFFCCILGIALSGNAIYVYFHPEKAITAYTID